MIQYRHQDSLWRIRASSSRYIPTNFGDIIWHLGWNWAWNSSKDRIRLDRLPGKKALYFFSRLSKSENLPRFSDGWIANWSIPPDNVCQCNFDEAYDWAIKMVSKWCIVSVLATFCSFPFVLKTLSLWLTLHQLLILFRSSREQPFDLLLIVVSWLRCGDPRGWILKGRSLSDAVAQRPRDILNPSRHPGWQLRYAHWCLFV